MLLLACAAPEEPATKAPVLEVPGVVGDEIVAVVTGAGAGDWVDADEPGTLAWFQLGGNARRGVVLPGGIDAVQRVSLGAWDGGELTWSADVDATLEVDATAADTPVVGLISDDWSSDVPFLTYHQDDDWTWVFSDEDGGTGLIPTLLLAVWGRPVDIEGLWDGAEIQSTDHTWIPFSGPYEGTHPLFEVVTYNGLIGPLDAATILLSPAPVVFDGSPREAVLDTNGWVLEASFAEAEREGVLVEDGGQDDMAIGAIGDYLFVDYDTGGDVRIAFEAEVDGAWWSSTNGLSTSGGMTDARLSGVGRTCVELPPGRDADDVTGVRVRAYEGDGTVTARWFSVDGPLKERGAGTASFTAGATVSL